MSFVWILSRATLSLFSAAVNFSLYLASLSCFCSDNKRSSSAQANEIRRGVHTLYAFKHSVNLALTAPNRASDFCLWVASFKFCRSSMVFAACVRASTPAVRVLKLKLSSHALRKLNLNVLVEGNELARTPLLVFGEVVCKFLAYGNKDK